MNFTTNYNLYLPIHGEYPGSWDIPVNRNFSSIDSIIRSLEINNKSYVAPEDKEAGSLWYNQTIDKLMIKKPSGYFNLIDSENYVEIIGNVVTDDGTSPPSPEGLVLNSYPQTPVGQVPLYVIEANWNPSNDPVNYPDLFHDDFASYILTILKGDGSNVEQRISYTNKYCFNNIQPGFEYSISVQVVDKLGHKSQDSITATIGVYDSSIVPSAPSGITASGTFKGIIVSWNKPLANNITGFEVHASEVSGFTPDAQSNADAPLTSSTLKYSGLSTITTITKGISTNTTYYIKVRAKNSSGNWSAFSSVTSATTKGVGTADFDELSVTHEVIADLAVDDAKISSLDASKIKTGFIDADRIEAESITGDKLAFKSISADKIIGGGDLVDVAANKDIAITAGNEIEGGMCSYTTIDSGSWQVFSSQLPASATVDIAGEGFVISELSEITFTSHPTTSVNYIPGKFILEHSVDGYIWNTIKEEDSNFGSSATPGIFVSLADVSARYVRLTIPEGSCQAGMDFVLISNFKVKARKGGVLITGDTVKAGTILAKHISTEKLSAISADLGSIEAGTIDIKNAHGWIRSGMSGYNAGQGFWLGVDNDNIPKISIGDAQGAGIHWDGSQLKITGDVLIGVAPDGTGGIYANDIGTSEPNYLVVVESTNGDSFKPGEAMSTTLIAHVFQGQDEVTDRIDASRFRWRRVSYYTQPPPNDDDTWNMLYQSGYKQITITTNTVASRATFHCDIMSTT